MPWGKSKSDSASAPNEGAIPFGPQGLQRVAKSVEALAGYVKTELADLKDQVAALAQQKRQP